MKCKRFNGLLGVAWLAPAVMAVGTEELTIEGREALRTFSTRLAKS